MKKNQSEITKKYILSELDSKSFVELKISTISKNTELSERTIKRHLKNELRNTFYIHRLKYGMRFMLKPEVTIQNLEVTIETPEVTHHNVTSSNPVKSSDVTLPILVDALPIIYNTSGIGEVTSGEVTLPSAFLSQKHEKIRLKKEYLALRKQKEALARITSEQMANEFANKIESVKEEPKKEEVYDDDLFSILGSSFQMKKHYADFLERLRNPRAYALFANDLDKPTILLQRLKYYYKQWYGEE